MTHHTSRALPAITGLIMVALSNRSVCKADTATTAYRNIPQSRSISAVDVADFFDNMASGSLPDLRKTGPATFEFELQDRAVYGEQGSLMVWFHGMCDLRGVAFDSGDRLHMNVRGSANLKHIRPVYSYDDQIWEYVPEGWGQRGDRFQFDLPLKPGISSVRFAAHYPYPAHRVLTRAIGLARNPLVRTCKVAGQTERGRPILLITIADPVTTDRGRRAVLLSSGMHGGETASLWGLEGAIDFLLSDKPEAVELRRKAVFHIVPCSNMDAFSLGLDRRQATGINIYFDFSARESAEARILWRILSDIRPQIWLDFHSWHLGKAEGLYGPDPKVVGEDKCVPLKPLVDAVATRFPVANRGADAMECSSTQAMLNLGVLGFSPEFNMGQGADGRWKTIEDQKSLGTAILLGLLDYLRAQVR